MRPVIAQEFKQRRLGILFWCLGSVIYTLLVTAVYKSFVTNQTVNLGQTIQKLPDTVKSFTSITSSFNTPSGFLSSEPYYVVLPIIFLVLAISLASGLLAREEAGKTLELLLARPLGRGRLLAAKALAGILILAVVNIVAGLAMTILTRVFGIHIGVGLLWEAQAMLYLLALLFGALAFMITAIGRAGHSAALGIAMLLAIGGYVLTSLEGAVHWLHTPARLLPYHYYQPAKILNGTFTTRPAIGFAIIALIFGIIAWLAFRRRDIA
ncbi:MAG TPA: ABC transporter permease subunit [Candidatus Saccharimonadales bacterium]|nr:ABC transporter permease subunit [Candidatus Saccharimonadales bacterium]